MTDLTAHVPPAANAAQIANANGMAAMQRGDFKTARAEFTRASEADPNAGQLWRNLAHACRQIGDDAGERAALDRALSIDRRDIAALLRSAELHQRRGELGEALAEWSGVIQLASGMSQAPPALTQALAEGQRFVAEQQARLARHVDAELDDLLIGMDARGQRRGQAFVDRAMGRRATYTNECHGLYYPFLPADEFFDADHFPWFDVLREAAPAIRAEFEALQSRDALPLRPYVQMEQGLPDNLWTALDGNMAWSAAFLWEYGVPNEELLALCPATAAMLEAIPRAEIPGRAPTAFFSILRAGAHIPPHTGVSNTRAIVHLPLVVPEGCGFRVGGETREWCEREPFAFDDTIEHEAWNRSGTDRALLILDVWNPHLTEAECELITRYYASADQVGLNPEKRDI